MAQHFLLSKAAKTLSLASVFRMSDEEAEQTFMGVRWADTRGEPVGPKCGCLDNYRFRRETGLLCFECSACRKEFSLTSGTLFASRKLPIKGYLAAIAIFCNEVKGKSMPALSRHHSITYKAVIVLALSLRRA